ncbi:beta-glucosidase [Ranunculus cassubicifolius]
MKKFVYNLIFFIWPCVALFHEEIRRTQFPDKFLFGASTSSYQIEGAVLEDGRGLSSWDVFSHIQGTIVDGLNADVAADHYHQWEDDIKLLHLLGVDSYRFSISWSRILPRGRFGEINHIGIKFYDKLIDDLLHKGIVPFVTLSHYDIPQELEDRYQSWLSPLIQEDFLFFAEICFKSFGDRVKYWVTINEPVLFTALAYLHGIYPPGRCSAPFGNCSSGNSDREPLIVIHNMILSHTKAVEVYRKHYQPKQGGYIGIVVDAMMYEPYKDDDIGRDAVNRALAFNVAWVLDPLIHGYYPPEMRQHLGEDLPVFSVEDSNKMKDSLDFIGLNHYTSAYAKDCILSACEPCSSRAIAGYVNVTGERDGIPIGEKTAMYFIHVVPNGMEKIIEYLKTRYNNKPVFVTENGYPGNELLDDIKRVEYHKSYLASLARAIKGGADVRGYFVWSLMDTFEWTSGYSLRFGLHYVDFRTLERKPKLSAKWYKDFLTNGTKSNHQYITKKGIIKDEGLEINRL